MYTFVGSEPMRMSRE